MDELANLQLAYEHAVTDFTNARRLAEDRQVRIDRAVELTSIPLARHDTMLGRLGAIRDALVGDDG